MISLVFHGFLRYLLSGGSCLAPSGNEGPVFKFCGVMFISYCRSDSQHGSGTCFFQCDGKESIGWVNLAAPTAMFWLTDVVVHVLSPFLVTFCVRTHDS